MSGLFVALAAALVSTYFMVYRTVYISGAAVQFSDVGDLR